MAGPRRPADVWFPHGPGGRGQALDFACSHVEDLLWRSRDEPSHVLDVFEELKGEFKDTDRLCENSDFAFIPVVMVPQSEAWSLVARRILDDLAKGQAAAANADPAQYSPKIAQRLSISLHQENPQAVLRRMSPPQQPGFSSGWLGVFELEAA